MRILTQDATSPKNDIGINNIFKVKLTQKNDSSVSKQRLARTHQSHSRPHRRTCTYAEIHDNYDPRILQTRKPKLKFDDCNNHNYPVSTSLDAVQHLSRTSITTKRGSKSWHHALWVIPETGKLFHIRKIKKVESS